MPAAPLRPCAHPGCTALVRGGRCAKHQRQQSQQQSRYNRDPRVQRMYNSKRWREIRQAQLDGEPFCRECRRQGRWVKASHADHIEPHNGDEEKFWHGELQSLCDSCHTAKTNRERSETPGGSKKFSNFGDKAGRNLPDEKIPDRNRDRNR